MDIKLKNNKKSINRRILILSLCIAIFPILLGLSKGFSKPNSNIYKQYILNLINGLPYKDENENIREDAIINEIDQLKSEYKQDYVRAQNDLNLYSTINNIDPNAKTKVNEDDTTYDKNYANYTQSKYECNLAQKNLNKSEEEYRQEATKNINQKLINNNIVNNQKNIEYYIENQDGQIISNISEQSKTYIIDKTKNLSKDYIMFLDITNNSPKEIHVTNNMKWAFDDLIHNNKIDDKLVNYKNVIVRISTNLIEGDDLYIKYKNNSISNTLEYVSLLLLALDLCIISILVRQFVKDKEPSFNENIILKLYNKLLVEIRVIFIIILLILLLGLHDLIDPWGISLLQMYITNVNLTPQNSFYFQVFITFLVAVVLNHLIMCDIYILNLIKKTIGLKSYLYQKSIFCKIYSSFKTSFFNTSMGGRMTVLISIIALYLSSTIWAVWSISTHRGEFTISVSVVISILTTFLIIIYIIMFAINLYKINLGTQNIVNGIYNNEIKIKGSFILQELADNITNIENGLDNSINKAIKSEKMKGELITNVSHDLKTPLTSIINYVDLLDNDNISEDKRKAYLEILKERSLRLKVLIEDLFEASKAASGNLEMHMEALDPIALLRQTLGEFEDKISISNLEFIKNIPDQKLSIYADGKKTFRVFQNLISNILKYSLRGTRVYIDVEEKDNFVSMTFKNISEYPLNFTEDEILERFKRGDVSRTTEGSGLGLSIAKNLVELQKGSFELNFDGDLFKVSVLLRKESF